MACSGPRARTRAIGSIRRRTRSASPACGAGSTKGWPQRRLHAQRSRSPSSRARISAARQAELRTAFEAYDDAAVQSALDVLLATFTFETVAREVMLPLLREIGDRWELGEISVAQEHFASSLLRGRLLSIARGWDRGVGPRAVLACAPGSATSWR